MATAIEIDKYQKILHSTVFGVMHTNCYTELVQEVLNEAQRHKDYNVLVDLRRTVTAIEMIDLMTVVSAWSRLGAEYSRKIAVIIPRVEKRLQSAQIVRTFMDAHGYSFKHFFDLESAWEWLIESPPIKPVPYSPRSASS